MKCNCMVRLFLLILLCLALTTAAAASAFTPGIIQTEVSQTEEETQISTIPPAVGGLGIVVLLIFGTIASWGQRKQEELGYDPVQEAHKIGDPYTRLSGEKPRRRFPWG